MPTHQRSGQSAGGPTEADSGAIASQSNSSAQQLASATVTRLTVNIGPTTAEALHLVAQREGVTVTEALRRLVGYGDLLYRAMKVDGKDVLLRQGKETQQILIP